MQAIRWELRPPLRAAHRGAAGGGRGVEGKRFLCPSGGPARPITISQVLVRPAWSHPRPHLIPVGFLFSMRPLPGLHRTRPDGNTVHRLHSLALLQTRQVGIEAVVGLTATSGKSILRTSASLVRAVPLRRAWLSLPLSPLAAALHEPARSVSDKADDAGPHPSLLSHRSGNSVT